MVGLMPIYIHPETWPITLSVTASICSRGFRTGDLQTNVFISSPMTRRHIAGRIRRYDIATSAENNALQQNKATRIAFQK